MKKVLFTLIIIITVLINMPAKASSTVIRSHIDAVKIVVINQDGSIAQIYRNTSDDVSPLVRRLDEQGETVNATPQLMQQLATIEQTLPPKVIGKVYDHPQLPSLLDTLYAML